MYAFNQEWVDRRSERWRQEKMDLNIVVLAGELAGDPSIQQAINSPLNEVEAIVRTAVTTPAGVDVETNNSVFWDGVSDDELASLELCKGDRVWVAGYLTSDGTYLDHVTVHAHTIQKGGDYGDVELLG